MLKRYKLYIGDNRYKFKSPSFNGKGSFVIVTNNRYLYFTMPNGGEITLTKNGTPTEVTLEYSLDNGLTWTEWIETENVRSLTLASGQTMHVRNTSETSTRFSTSSRDYYNFAFTAYTYVGGNTDSLLCKIPSNASITNYCYTKMFNGCTNLMMSDTFTLPSTTLAGFCYASMFRDCTSLTMSNTFTLPSMTMVGSCYNSMFYGCTSLTMGDTFTLPAPTLANYCYAYIFHGCTNVNLIKTNMTDISAGACLYNWSNNVSPTGDFYCPIELQIPTGASGIPSGWTRHDIYNNDQYLKNESDLEDEDVALCIEAYDGLRFIKVEDAPNVDLSKYSLKPYVRFHRGKNGRSVVIHKDEIGSNTGAILNKYKLECDLTSNGSFDWSVNISGTVKSGHVSWTSSSTLDNIVTQLNTSAGTNLTFSHINGENFIRIFKGGRTYSIFTLTNNTGATLTDLSLYTKINGVQQEEVHRDWHNQHPNTIFPNIGFLPSNNKQYAKNGYNLSFCAGANLERFKAYCETSGSSTYVAENSVSVRMKKSVFNSLNNDGNAEHQALYDKYNGYWDAYMEASMVQINDIHTDGIEYQSYDNGDTQTAALASITTMDFDGTYTSPYPFAYDTHQITDSTLGAFNVGTVHEMAVIMEDSKMIKINEALSYLINYTYIKSDKYYWTTFLYSSSEPWAYLGNRGSIYAPWRWYEYKSRAFAYLN